MKAMVLAAGRGTRLQPLTQLIAKPAMPIGPRALIEWLLLHLATQGVEEAVINLHHLPDSIRERVEEGRHLGVHVSYSEEPELLGSGGGLARARARFDGEEEILMVNGDSLFDFDLGEAVEAHRRSGALATMILLPPQPGYAPVEMSDGLVCKIAGRPRIGTPGDPYLFPGIHILSGRLLRSLPDGSSEINRQIYPAAIEKGERINGHVVEGSWYEFGDPALYRQNTLGFLTSRGLLAGGNAIGERLVIEPGSVLSESILWDDVRVTGAARVERCIITSGSRVHGGSYCGRIITPCGEYPL